MPVPALDPLILSFYRDRYVEDERLTSTPHGRIEFVRTQQLLRRRMPTAPALIADVGGGTGVHARWLAADGHDVQVIDPVPEHVKAAAGLPGVTAQVGDARFLTLADRSVDVTLLLGPLYHLTDRRDRMDALAEAVRITRPDGLVVVAAISRYAALLELAALGALDGAEYFVCGPEPMMAAARSLRSIFAMPASCSPRCLPNTSTSTTGLLRGEVRAAR